MALPEVKVNSFEETLLSDPSKVVKYRPYTTKDEKEFLLAVETEDVDKITAAVEAIVKNCVQDIDVDTEMSPVDVNLMLLRIRQKGKGDVITFAWKCDAEGCDAVHRDTIDTQEEVEYKVADNSPISVGDWKINIKWPSNALVNKLRDLGDVDRNYKLLAYSIKSIVDGESVSDEFTPDEIEEWVEKLPPKLFSEFTENYKNNSPRVIVNKIITCDKCNKERNLELEEAAAFFLS